jgi:Xaa-Pro aminopeptidase
MIVHSQPGYGVGTRPLHCAYHQIPYTTTGQIVDTEIYRGLLGKLVPGRGIVTVEDMIVVTESGAEYLSTPQRQLILISR